MQNRESLAHALEGDAKRKYNAKYYQQNKEYWVEWRDKHKNSGRGGGSSWDDISSSGGHGTQGGGSSWDHQGSGGGSSWEKKNPFHEIKPASESTKSYQNYRTQNAATSRFYKNYYDNTSTAIRNMKTGINRKITMAAERISQKQAEEQAKRIRIRNRTASIAKLEYEEQKRKANKFPYKVVNKVKSAISSVAMSLVDTWAQGKKELNRWLAK